MPTDTQRDQAFANANKAQIYLYSHNDAGASLSKIAQKYDLTEYSVYKMFATIVGDIVLGFYQDNQIVTALREEVGLGNHMSEMVANDVRRFLAPLNDPNWKHPTSPGEENINETNVIGFAKEIAETEASLNAIPTQTAKPKETSFSFADTEEVAPEPLPVVAPKLQEESPVPMYTSTQSAILEEGYRPVNQTEKPQLDQTQKQNDHPRWETG